MKTLGLAPSVFISLRGETESNREGVGEREFPVEEGSERSERWKTVGFQRVR